MALPWVLWFVVAAPTAWAGVLDPRLEGSVFCLLGETFIPDNDSRFVSGLSSGGFVLGYKKGSSLRVLAALFDEDGQQVGPEIVVDEPFVGEQEQPDTVIGSADGRWLVTWSGHGSPGTDQSLTSVKARLFADSGTPLGDSFQVNSFELEVQSKSNAVFLADGGFVVVFESSSPLPLVNDIRARIFSADGQPAGDDFIVNGTGEGRRPEVVALPDGGFVVAYRALTADNDSLGLGVRHYDALGAVRSTQFIPVEEDPEEGVVGIRAEVDPGDSTLLLAVVINQRQGELDRLVTRLVDLRRVGDRFLKTHTFEVVSPASLSANWDPSLLVPGGPLKTLVWDRNLEGLGDDFEVLARSFSQSIEPVSETIRVDDPIEHSTPGAALVGDHRAIVAWRPVVGTCEMEGRFLRLPEVLFMDGFEDGTTAAWSSTVP
jgi:hypothetical protein